MKKYSLKELSIIISLKIDSPDRAHNLRYLLHYFNDYFDDLEIIIIEQVAASPLHLPKDNKGNTNTIVYERIDDRGPHYKTRNLNLASALATREIIMMCDCDVLLPPKILSKAVQHMKASQKVFLSPHNGVMVEIAKKYLRATPLERLIESLVFFPRNFDTAITSSGPQNMYPIYGGRKTFSTGGCILYHKRDFFIIGGWNTNIISYGYEDMEFIYRAKKLGIKHATLKANNIYHMQHHRGQDSTYNGFYRSNELEWHLVTSMNKKTLKMYSLNGYKRLSLENDTEYSVINTPQKFSIAKLTTSKVDLSGIPIFLLLDSIAINRVHLVSLFAAYLEKYFKKYEINVVEFRTRHCVHLTNKRGVNHYCCRKESFNGYRKFVMEIMASLPASTIGIWDFTSFLDPEKVRTSVELFNLHKMETTTLEDELWAPEGVWRTEPKGRGLTILKKNNMRPITITRQKQR